MNVELDKIKIPSYPLISYNFIRRLRGKSEVHFKPGAFAGWQANGGKEREQCKEKTESHSMKLDIAVISAGVGGLSNAIALQTAGHNVQVYEQAPALGEIGAGIQIPPNSPRILHSWGMQTFLERRSVKPAALMWRRWEDGRVIAKAVMNPSSEQKFVSPYYVTHRAHLHAALHEAAVKLGVATHLNRRTTRYNTEEGRVWFDDGTEIQADLVVAADGLKSLARRTLNGEKESPRMGTV